MPAEPPVKRAVAFVDGQNLFHSVKSAFGYTYPNYDVVALAGSICANRGWQIQQVRFYTGVPDATDNAFWSAFWAKKLLAMSRAGVWTFSRSLRYRNQTVKLPDGTAHAVLAAEEKGVDVRIALDIIRMAHRNEYDVALVFSQDQDLSEVAAEVRVISADRANAQCTSCCRDGSPDAQVAAFSSGSESNHRAARGLELLDPSTIRMSRSASSPRTRRASL